MKKQSIKQSFFSALRGLIWSFKTQPNLFRGSICGIIALLCSFLFPLSSGEKILIFFTVLLFFIAEMINTSLEAIVDLITQTKHKQARIAKDVASGMVLLTSIGAFLVGLFIFGPYIIKLLR